MILPDGQVTAGAGAAGQGEPQCIGAEQLHPVQRVDAVAARFAHFAAVFVADQAVQEDVRERDLGAAPAISGDRVVVRYERPEHHHAGDPEKQNVVAGDENTGRIELLEIRGAVRPAHRGKRP